jgi:gamma-glutamyl-gamma-aminobutyrate hydrolase PuuD
MKPSVYVIGREHEYEQMFLRHGWSLVNSPEDADLIQFTGGADVDPMLYEEPRHPRTYSDPDRDSKEANIYNKYSGEIPMAGICRGGQFLCVMNGGRMWQDVNNHTVGAGHYLIDVDTCVPVQVSSTHHQMMDPTTAGSYRILATSGLCTRRSDGWGNDIISKPGEEADIEAVYFPETDCICFQPHPEFFDENHECQQLFFRYLDEYLGLKA